MQNRVLPCGNTCPFELFCTVYEALEEGVGMDSIYLGFAKDFAKVDHDILKTK